MCKSPEIRGDVSSGKVSIQLTIGALTLNKYYADFLPNTLGDFTTSLGGFSWAATDVN